MAFFPVQRSPVYSYVCEAPICHGLQSGPLSTSSRIRVPSSLSLASLSRTYGREQFLVETSTFFKRRTLAAVSAARFTPVVAFVKSEETIQVAVDAYKLLGVSLIASEDTILKAYDRLITASPEAEFSQEMLCSRAVVLKAAADALLNRGKRHVYDQTGTLEIPHEDLPGAIGMLAEAGDWVTALEWGKAWLSANSGHPCSTDIAVCVAIAQCDRAAAELDAAEGSVHTAAAALESGLQLLQRYGCGEKLQLEIKSTLQELMPKVLLHSIASPETALQPRTHLIAALKRVLWNKGSPVSSFPILKLGRQRYLEALCAHLTAAEQVQLFEGSIGSPGTSDEEIHSAAIANLAAGLKTFTPAHIKTAIQLLRSIGDKTEPATGRKRFDAIDVTVELAVCHLLLGEVFAAEDALGLAEASSRLPDPAIKQFVQSQCTGDPHDLLPGLYSLAQQWVVEVAAERHPELKRAGVDFDAWFSNPRVSLYLQVVDKSKQLGLSNAGDAVKGGLTAFFGSIFAALFALWKLLMSPLHLLQRPPSQPAAAAQEFPELQAGSQESATPKLDSLPETPALAVQSNELRELAESSPPVISTPESGSTPNDPTGPLGVSSSAMEPGEMVSNIVGLEGPRAFSSPDPTKASGSIKGNEALPSPKIRQEVGVPLATVTDQTVGEIQQQLQDVLPLEDEEDGFSTEYFDAPVPQPPFAGSARTASLARNRSPALLAMQGEREMWVSYQNERRKSRTLLLLFGLICLGYAVHAVLNPAATATNPLLCRASRFVRGALPLGASHAACACRPLELRRRAKSSSET